jgi:hypothetical protein
VFYVNAQSQVTSNLVVADTDGNTTHIPFDGSEIIIENGVIKVNGQSFNFEDVDNFYFKKSETSVANIQNQSLKVFIDRADNLQLSSETALGDIEIFSITGRLLKKTHTSDVVATIPVYELERGVYLLKTGSQTVKFIR